MNILSLHSIGYKRSINQITVVDGIEFFYILVDFLSVVLSLVERKMLKSPTIIADLPNSPFNSTSFCSILALFLVHVYLGVLDFLQR